MGEKELTVQIGRRFRAFRVTQGLSQKQLAAILREVTHINISRLERGAIRRLSIVFLNDCRAKFGMSMDWLLTGQGPMLLPEVEFKAGLPSDLSHQKGRKERSNRGFTLAKQRSLQRKLDQLTASLAKATRLVQELFAQTTSNIVPPEA